MKILIMLLMLMGLNVKAEVIETSNYSDILKYVTPNTLVVTDLDNTVIEPVQTLGSDQWGESVKEKLLAVGYDKEAAIDIQVSLFSIVQNATKVKTVEAGTARIINQLKDLKIPIIGLTARPLYIMDRTVKLLDSVNVNFSGISGLEKKVNLISSNDAKIATKSGIIFIGPRNNKGEVLKNIFDQLKEYHFKRIIFIDDKVHHVNNVDAAFKDSGVEVKALRYGETDARVKSYDAKIADYEWVIFQKTGIILNDDHARISLKTEVSK